MKPKPASALLLDRLRDVATCLGTADPTNDLAEAIDCSFDWSLDDQSYVGNALQPGALPVEWSFSEASPKSFRIDFEPCGPGASAQDRQTEATRLVRAMIQRRAGAAELARFDRACERGRAHAAPELRFGAFLGACIGPRGLSEAKVYYEAGPWKLDVMSPRVRDAVGTTCAAIEGWSPLLYSVSWSSAGVAERVYMVCRKDLRLLDLRECLEALGLLHRAPDLIVTAYALSGTFVLPADATVFSLREIAGGFEVKLELVAGALPGRKESIWRDLRAILSQRPDSLCACDRWLQAVAPASGLGAELSVSSIRITPETASRLSVYVRVNADDLKNAREGALPS